MPRIIEYESKGKIEPNSEGYSAYEQAARRTGPLAQQSASDVEKLGRMAAETGGINAKFAYEYTSPFADLLDKATKAAAAPKSTSGGTGFKVQGDKSSGVRGGGRPNVGGDADANLAGQAVPWNGRGGPDITRAAAALAKQANSQLNPKAAPGGGTVIGMDANGHPIIREKNGNIKTNESQTGQSTTVLRGGQNNAADINAGTVVLRDTGNTS